VGDHHDQVAAVFDGRVHDGVVHRVGGAELPGEGHALFTGLCFEVLEHFMRVRFGAQLVFVGLPRIGGGVRAHAGQGRHGLGHEAGDARAELAGQLQAGIGRLLGKLAAVQRNEDVLEHDAALPH
jgi:hypothetical protein